MSRSERLVAAADFVDRLAGVTTLDRLASAFSREIAAFGFDVFACGALPSEGNGRLSSEFFFSTWPKPWLDTYVAEGFAKEDPIVRAARLAVLPISWDEIGVAIKDRPEAVRVLNAARDGGWTTGLVIPISGPGGYRGTVSLAGEHAELSAGERAMLVGMAMFLHEKARDIATGGTTCEELPLSPRERECVKWLVAGMSDPEIADRLGISRTTAHFHVENAKRKFGARTRAQLAALAVWRGLVSP